MRPLIAILFTALATGCAAPQITQAGDNDTVVLDEAKVLAIARKAVAASDRWVDRAEFQPPVRKRDGSWHVGVWRLPKQPGGHRLIVIDQKGSVSKYLRGR